MGNCECGTYHRCHGDKACGHLRGADIPIRYKETEVYYEKIPLEPDKVTSSTETIYEKVRRTRTVVTYKKVLTPRWVPTSMIIEVATPFKMSLRCAWKVPKSIMRIFQ